MDQFEATNYIPTSLATASGTVNVIGGRYSSGSICTASIYFAGFHVANISGVSTYGCARGVLQGGNNPTVNLSESSITGASYDLAPNAVAGQVINLGSSVTLGCQSSGATFTATASGTNLTVSSVVGTIYPGNLVTGTGVPAGTTLVSQTSGPTGGAGVYVTSASTTASAASLATSEYCVQPGAEAYVQWPMTGQTQSFTVGGLAYWPGSQTGPVGSQDRTAVMGVTQYITAQNTASNPAILVSDGTSTSKLQNVSGVGTYVGSQTSTPMFLMTNNSRVAGVDTCGNFGVGSSATPASDPFNVSSAGAVTASSVTINGGTAMAGTVGNGGRAQETTTAAKISGDCVQFDTTGNTVDAGAGCGGVITASVPNTMVTVTPSGTSTSTAAAGVPIASTVGTVLGSNSLPPTSHYSTPPCVAPACIEYPLLQLANLDAGSTGLSNAANGIVATTSGVAGTGTITLPQPIDPTKPWRLVIHVIANDTASNNTTIQIVSTSNGNAGNSLTVGGVFLVGRQGRSPCR